jgi:hypothetical protein
MILILMAKRNPIYIEKNVKPKKIRKKNKTNENDSILKKENFFFYIFRKIFKRIMYALKKRIL